MASAWTPPAMTFWHKLCPTRLRYLRQLHHDATVTCSFFTERSYLGGVCSQQPAVQTQDVNTGGTSCCWMFRRDCMKTWTDTETSSAAECNNLVQAKAKAVSCESSYTIRAYLRKRGNVGATTSCLREPASLALQMRGRAAGRSGHGTCTNAI